jgi:hypothetical protein
MSTQERREKFNLLTFVSLSVILNRLNYSFANQYEMEVFEKCEKLGYRPKGGDA